jgi:hypothetical protein
MGALIFAGCLALVSLAAPLAGDRRQERMMASVNEKDLVRWRVMADAAWGELVLGSWAVLSAAGGAFLLNRSHGIGWAWIGVGVVFVLAVVAARRYRSGLRTMLDERSVPHLPRRHRSGIVRSYWYVALGTTGYLGMRIVEYAYPDDPPSGATTAIGVFGLALIVGAIGFIAVRARMYLKGDDLAPPA